MFQAEFIRASLLEAGEQQEFAFRFVDQAGCIKNETGISCTVTSSNPSVVSVNGNTLLGVEPGEASILVVYSDPVIQDVEWKVTVIAMEDTPYRRKHEEPYVIQLPEELNDFRERIADKPRMGFLAPATIIDYGNLWKAYLSQAQYYLHEESFEVNYPSISFRWTIQLPLNEPDRMPEPIGYTDFPYWTMYSRAIEERLVVLSTVYLVTKQKEYADRIRGHLLDLSRYGKWYEFNHRGAEGNLSNAHFTIGVAAAYDSIRDTLTAEERVVIRKAIWYKGLQPLAVDIGNSDMHNIVAAKHVAMMYGAAALLDEIPYASKYLKASHDYVKSYLDRKIRSGETEGLLYDNVAARHAWMAADLYRRVSGDSSLVEHPYLKDELPERFLRLLSPGESNTFPNFSDSFYKLDIAYLMIMTAAHHKHPAAMWYVNQFGRDHTAALIHLRGGVPAEHPEDYYNGQASYIFPTIGWAALRSGWKERDHLLCFTSGPSDRDHNHKDQNNLMLNVAGEWLITGPGYQDYAPGPKADYTTGTIGHNSLLVNSQGQAIRGGGFLHDYWLQPSIEAVCGDATASYNRSLKSYQRTILHLDASYYIIIDDVELQRAGDEAELLFHTTSVIKEDEVIKQPGDVITGNTVVLQGEIASLQLSFVTPDSSAITVHSYPGAEMYGPYISVRTNTSRRTKLVSILKPITEQEVWIQLKDVSQHADGAAGFTLLQNNGSQDIILLSDESQELAYNGYRFKGCAARMNYSDNHSLNSGWSAMLSLWQVNQLIGNGLYFSSDQSLCMTLDMGNDLITIRNRHPFDVDCEFSIEDIGLYFKSSLSPGEHVLPVTSITKMNPAGKE